MRLHRSLFRFAKKKEIVVKNFFNQTGIGKYTSFNDAQLDAFVEQSKACKKRWLEMRLDERELTMMKFCEELKGKEHSQRIANLLSQCTGKQLSQCQSESRVAFKILSNHLRDLSHTQRRHEYPAESGKLPDYYEFQPFDHLLSVFDHRHPILSAVKYMGMALSSGTFLILRPSHTVLPVIKAIQEVWTSICKRPIFTCISDAELDPKHEDSPMPKIFASTDGFVSFDGRMTDGFNFHFFMTQNSENLRDSQFLLTSSDSAYVMASLNVQKLQKAAKIIARGCFSNCGHSFNSIKRVYVDRQVGESFIELLVAESKNYTAGSSESYDKVNNGLLAPFVFKRQLEEAVNQLKQLKEKHNDEFKHIAGGEEVSVKIGERSINFLTPSIFQVTADFPNYNYQNEEFMLPICFISFVDSSSSCIQRINSSIFGTTTSLFTADSTLQAVQPIGKKIDVGTINVNTWEVTDGITYSGRKRSGKGFCFSPLSYHNILRTRAVSYS